MREMRNKRMMGERDVRDVRERGEREVRESILPPCLACLERTPGGICLPAPQLQCLLI